MSNFLDLSGADTSGIEPLPSGEYDATLISVEATESSTGKPMVKTVFGVSEEPYEGRKIWGNFVLQGNSDEGTKKLLGNFVNFLAACGVEEGDEDTIKESGFSLENLGDLIGSEVVLRLGPPDAGQSFNNLKGVKPAGSKIAAAAGGLL